METPPPSSAEQETLLLHAEDISVSKRRVVTGRVRVRLSTQAHEKLVDETISHETVDIERVAIGRFVDSAPEMRVEGDVTIIPVVEEILVVERRLVLKEEIRLHRVRTSERHRETISLREQTVTIERDAEIPVAAGDQPGKS
jgi:uncharacterized protein (TIGR02271 family)